MFVASGMQDYQLYDTGEGMKLDLLGWKWKIFGKYLKILGDSCIIILRTTLKLGRDCYCGRDRTNLLRRALPAVSSLL